MRIREQNDGYSLIFCIHSSKQPPFLQECDYPQGYHYTIVLFLIIIAYHEKKVADLI